MTTDPGNLVVDPTCGVTGDVREGFVYKRVPHVRLKSVANNSDIKEGMARAEIDAAIARQADTELLFAVTGPFVVESLSPHRVLAADGGEPATEREGRAEGPSGRFELMVSDNLRKASVPNTVKNERLKFDRLDPYAGIWPQAAGEYTDAAGNAPLGRSAQRQQPAVARGPAAQP
jgi:adenine-specific DNA-methyltransferase